MPPCDAPVFDTGNYLMVGDPIGIQEEIDVGMRATSTVVDVNSDGKKDLVIGALDGKIHVYINENTNEDPIFYEEIILMTSNGSELVVHTERSSPEVRDFNDDGLLDIMSGNTEGQLLLYLAPGFSYYMHAHSAGEPIDLDGEARSRPATCDWTSDERLDVLLGAGDGLVRLYQGLNPADLNGDGRVNVTDLLILLGNWGGSGIGDINEDGVVNVTDLLILLGEWGSGC